MIIRNAEIVTEDGIISGGSLRVEDGVVTAVAEAGRLEPAGAGEAVVDAGGSWLLPGFIDVHVHGGYGADFMDATPEAIDTIARFHASRGTTSLLATTMTAAREELDRVLDNADRYVRGPMRYAQVLGVHLEGPFISPRFPGAQNPSHIAPPQRMWLEAWEERFPRLLRIVTLAPEREGALEAIAWLRDRGIVPAAGHTAATYADVQSAVGAGLSHAVHAFNAMSALHHREPGTVGAVLTDPRISAEVIADGHHVHKAAIRLLTQTKTQRNLLLITDAISAAGLGDGDYALGGLDVVVRQGVARLREGGALAGSTLTMIDALRFMVREVGVSVADASRYASGNPARRLGLEERLGSIAAGKQADLLLVSPQLDLQRVWIRGAEPEFGDLL